jgi:hypothetical protein
VTADTIPVVREAWVLDEAYCAGYERFDGGPTDAEPHEALSHYRETATWANIVAPFLRALSGYGETAGGTYTDNREVAVIPEGDGDDHPAEATVVDGKHVYDAVQTAWDRGAADAMEGCDHGESAGEVYIL